MSRYRYLLLDLDGTLVNFGAGEAVALKNTFEKIGISYTNENIEAYQKINTESWKNLNSGLITIQELKERRFPDFFESIHHKGDPVAANDFFIAEMGKQFVAFDETYSLLSELRKRGYILSVITNGLSSIQHSRIESAGADKYFDHIFVAEDLGLFKPNKDFFDKVLELIGVENRKDAIIIGDSLSADIQGGINSGIDTIWTNYRGIPSNPSIQPTFEIHQMKEILELLPPLV